MTSNHINTAISELAKPSLQFNKSQKQFSDKINQLYTQFDLIDLNEKEIHDLISEYNKKLAAEKPLFSFLVNQNKPKELIEYFHENPYHRNQLFYVRGFVGSIAFAHEDFRVEAIALYKKIPIHLGKEVDSTLHHPNQYLEPFSRKYVGTIVDQKYFFEIHAKMKTW